MKRLGAGAFLRGLWGILRGKPHLPPTLAANPLLTTILDRRSVRSFSRRPLAEDVFAAILEAGRLAPSTVNLQTWTFAAFDPPLWQATFERSLPFGGSRAVIVIADTTRARRVLDEFPYSPLVEYTMGVMNASLAAMNMNLAAEALGVASVMLSETGRTGLLDAGYLHEKLDLPPGAVPLLTIIFGYPTGPHPVMPPKLPLEQILCQGTYQPADAEVIGAWLTQMQAGYKASHLTSSFEKQLGVYRSKIGQAEADLRRMVYYREESV